MIILLVKTMRITPLARQTQAALLFHGRVVIVRLVGVLATVIAFGLLVAAASAALVVIVRRWFCGGLRSVRFRRGRRFLSVVIGHSDNIMLQSYIKLGVIIILDNSVMQQKHTRNDKV